MLTRRQRSELAFHINRSSVNHHREGMGYQGGCGVVQGAMNAAHSAGAIGNLQEAAQRLPATQMKAYCGRLLPAALYAAK